MEIIILLAIALFLYFRFSKISKRLNGIEKNLDAVEKELLQLKKEVVSVPGDLKTSEGKPPSQKPLPSRQKRRGCKKAFRPRGAINLFRRIRERSEGKRVEKRSPTGDVIAVLSDIPIAYFRSHPPFHARLAAIEREFQLQGWKLGSVKPLKTLP